MTMTLFHFTIFIWVFTFVVFTTNSWCPHHIIPKNNRRFEQKSDRFWEFHDQSNSWVEVELPHDLFSCINNTCTKVCTIGRIKNEEEKMGKEYEQRESCLENDGSERLEEDDSSENDGSERLEEDDSSDMVLPLRKRVSLTKMSEISIWVTGQSGSIYERFWNGVQWVVAPHDLPVSAGSVFLVNQTIFALSEAGVLYQMQLSEISQPIWVEFGLAFDERISKEEDQTTQIQSAFVSRDGLRVYFCTKSGMLVELIEIEPPRWLNHGQPPGADVAGIADAANIRAQVVYTISSTGDLYEYDRSSRPFWKKHIWRDRAEKDLHLLPSAGFTLHSLNGEYSISLFLLTKGGNLVERKLYKRKWKWIIHGRPKDHHLTSITPTLADESNGKFFSLFFTSSVGSVFEYRIPSYSGNAHKNQISEAWVNHKHPLHAKAARGVAGLQFQVGRILFALDDGRLGELHLAGLGGENSGPTHHTSRRKVSVTYLWTILDSPETEGWNAQYCTEERGLTNCVTGTKDDLIDSGIRSSTRRTKVSQAQQNYLLPGSSASRQMKSSDQYISPENWINENFRLRVVHWGSSFFFITDSGLPFEYLYTDDAWIWLRHESSTPIKGALGNYNGSIYLVDTYGSLLIRERNSNELSWFNCTAIRKGKRVSAGPPWDRIPGVGMKVTLEDAIFFVSKTGKLLQLTVCMRKFQWKDCRSPPETRVASIVDQEMFRENIVFIVGTNGQLYQYNKVTELWHEHHQSQHLILSRLPGTSMRRSLHTLTGSLFMISEDGGLVEYHWNTWDGWNWIEHGKPCKGVTLISAPGPCFEGTQLFFIGSDGKVYLRYMEQTTWRWKNCGFPHARDVFDKDQIEVCDDEDYAASLEMDREYVSDQDKNCDTKVASTRPIQFSEDAIIFELRDGRLAEMQRHEDGNWVWSRIIGTPTSLCIPHYWSAWPSPN